MITKRNIIYIYALVNIEYYLKLIGGGGEIERDTHTHRGTFGFTNPFYRQIDASEKKQR